MALKWNTRLELDGSQFIAAVRNAQKQLSATGVEIEKVSFSVKKMEKALSFPSLLRTASAFTGIGLGVHTITSALRSAIQTNVQFEKAISNLAAISGKTVKEISSLEREARRLGAATSFTAVEVAGLETELAKLGFTTREILQSTDAILKFAIATGTDLPRAAKLAGGTLRAFGADANEMERYVSSMAVATTKSALSVEYFETAMSIVGPVAHALGLTFEDTAAQLGVLADANFDASSAGTALRNIFLNLANTNSKLSREMGKPIRSAKDFSDGLQKLKKGGIELNETLELSDKRSVAAFATLIEGAEKIETLRKSITGVEGELSDMAATMGDNVSGAVNRLSSAWEGFVSQLSGSNGAIKTTIDLLGKLVQLATEAIEGEWDTEARQAAAAKKSELREHPALMQDRTYSNLLTMSAVGQPLPQSDAQAKLKQLEAQRKELEEGLVDKREEIKAEVDAIEALTDIDWSNLPTELLRKDWLPNVVPSDQLKAIRANYEKKKERIITDTVAITELDKAISDLKTAYNLGEKADNKSEKKETKSAVDRLKEEKKRIEAEMERIKAELVLNPNLTPEIQVKYYNDLASLQAALNEIKDREITVKVRYEVEQKYGPRGQEGKIAPTGNAILPTRGRDTYRPQMGYNSEQFDITDEEIEGIAGISKSPKTKKQAFSKMGDEIRSSVNKTETKSANFFEMFDGVSDKVAGVDSLIGSLETLGDVLESDASGWEKFMAGFDVIRNAVSGIQQLIEITNSFTTSKRQSADASKQEQIADMQSTMTQVADKTTLATVTESTEAAGAAATTAAATTEVAAKQTETAANVATAATGAASSQAGVPIIGPILAAIAVAGIMMLLQKFISGFATGGIVGGGSATGDKIPVRVNSGEMILNKGQQTNLYRGLYGGGGGNIGVSQQRRLFSNIQGFSGGGIAGVNIPTAYMPTTLGSAPEVSGVPTGGVQRMEVGGRLTADGDKLIAVINSVSKRRNNA